MRELNHSTHRILLPLYSSLIPSVCLVLIVYTTPMVAWELITFYPNFSRILNSLGDKLSDGWMTCQSLGFSFLSGNFDLEFLGWTRYPNGKISITLMQSCMCISPMAQSTYEDTLKASSSISVEEISLTSHGLFFIACGICCPKYPSRRQTSPGLPVTAVSPQICGYRCILVSCGAHR